MEGGMASYESVQLEEEARPKRVQQQQQREEGEGDGWVASSSCKTDVLDLVLLKLA